MDFENIIWLVMIGIGVLSSITGNKKEAQKKRQLQRQKLRESGQPSPAKPAAREPRREVASAMQEILRELQIVPPTEEPPVSVAPPPETAPEDVSPHRPPPTPRVQRPPPMIRPIDAEVMRPPVADTEPVRGWQGAVDELEAKALGGETHREFHDEFVKPHKKPRANRARSARVKRVMNRTGLRDSILAHEIFGPPKSMQ